MKREGFWGRGDELRREVYVEGQKKEEEKDAEKRQRRRRRRHGMGMQSVII